MRDGRWRRIAFGGAALLAMLFLAGCSPLNQGAVTLNEDSRLPRLVLAFCEGEGVEAVRLTEARIEDGIYDKGRTLWRIETTAPRPIQTVTAGEVPEGYQEVVPLATDLPDNLVMMAENGGSGGVAAEQGGGAFLLSELQPGVLLQDGDRVSAADLRRDARTNCSSSLFGSLGLPTWLDRAAAGGVGAAAITGLALGLRQRAKDWRRDRHEAPADAR